MCLLFLIFSATISSWGGMRDADERERISENSRTGQAGDSNGAVPRDDSSKLRAASAVPRHRYGHQCTQGLGQQVRRKPCRRHQAVLSGDEGIFRPESQIYGKVCGAIFQLMKLCKRRLHKSHGIIISL